jgi:hypothetical protein
VVIHRICALELQAIRYEKVPSAYVTRCKTRRAIYVNVTLSRSQVTNVAFEKQGITYSECVSVALVTQLQSSCIILYCHFRPVNLYCILPHYFINGTILGGKKLERKICAVSFSTFLILRRIWRDIIKMHMRLKVSVILVRF